MESWSLAVVAALLLAYAGLSHRLERTIVSAAMVFTAAGLLLGPEALDWLHFDLGSSEVRILAEITLTLVLFLDASRIDIRSLRRELGFPARLLGIGLPLTIVAGTLVGALLFDELGWAEVLVLAIVLAPTDAALGLPVVTDMRLPSRVRQSLNVESGLNDGICVPLLFIALAIAEAEEKAIGGGHAARIVAEEIGYGIVGGVAAGIAGSLVLRLASKHGLADEIWAKVIPVTAAALAYGIAAPLGGSGFIAAFVGGLVYGIVRGTGELAAPESSAVMDAAAEVFAALTFITFGSVALGWALHRVDWKVGALRGAQPHGDPHGAGRNLLHRLGREARDGRVCGMVRAARPRVDRLRGPRDRGVEAATCRPPDHGVRDHGRPLGARARRDRASPHGRLRPLVCATAERPRARKRTRPRAPLADGR